MNTYTGIVKVKNKTVNVSEKFKKREFVLTDNAQSYPQTILFQLTQDRTALLDSVNVGDEVTVHFQLKGREWKNPQGEIKFFNSIDVFRIDQAKKQEQQNQTLTPTPDDDLPF